ncbi:MAG: Ig-like domain-containing protein [Nannocystaceae bacterium]
MADQIGVRRCSCTFLLLAALLGACLDPKFADLDAPRVAGSSLSDARTFGVGVWPTFHVRFSEAMDPSSVRPGFVGIVAWDRVGVCDPDPRCEEGVCVHGVCWVDPLGPTELAALGRGQFVGEAVSTSWEGGEALGLEVGPRRALEPHTLYTFVIGEGVRDLSGAPLAGGDGLARHWRREFVTAGQASSGPYPQLVWPQPGERNVPTNLAWLETVFRSPVELPRSTDRLHLESDRGQGAIASDPTWCAGWVGGYCLRWRMMQQLVSERRYKVVSLDVEDRWGRGAVPTRDAQWFRVGPGEVLDPPSLSGVVVWTEGRCLFAWVPSDRPVVASLQAGERVAGFSGGGSFALALPLGELGYAPHDPISYRLTLEDLAGHRVVLSSEQRAGPGFDPTLARVAISEVLGDPLGLEPREEFVELVSLAEPGSPPQWVEGLWLSDLPWSDVRGLLMEGAEPPGDGLPAFELPWRARMLVVSEAFVGGTNGDVAVPDEVPRIHVDASLGAGGIKNTGEPLTLYRADPPALVSSFSAMLDTDPGQSSARADPMACDLPRYWAAHPGAGASPGTPNAD